MFNVLESNRVLVSGNTKLPHKKYAVKIKLYKNPSSIYTGVNVCMLGSNNGRSIMEHIKPTTTLFDKDIEHVYVFDAPDIGEIDGLMIAPETGTLAIERVDVMVNDELKRRFMGHEEIGGRGNDGAALLTPSLILTPEMKAKYDLEYLDLKNKINFGTLRLSLVGTVITACALGPSKAVVFSIGSILAMVYVQLLQYEMDRFGKRNQGVVMNTTARLALLFSVATALVVNHHDAIMQDNSEFIIGLLGFVMYKLSMIRLIKD